MKKTQEFPMMEGRTVAVLAGLAVGLGIVLHEMFFILGLGIVLVEITLWTARGIEEYLREFRMFHRYP